jgi:hypothetical protein
VVFDEEIFPFTKLHLNTGSRLQSEILLLPPSSSPLPSSPTGVNNNEMPVANFPNHAHEVCEDYDGVLVAFSEDIEHDVNSLCTIITN